MPLTEEQHTAALLFEQQQKLKSAEKLISYYQRQMDELDVATNQLKALRLVNACINDRRAAPQAVLIRAAELLTEDLYNLY